MEQRIDSDAKIDDFFVRLRRNFWSVTVNESYRFLFKGLVSSRNALVYEDYIDSAEAENDPYPARKCLDMNVCLLES